MPTSDKSSTTRSRAWDLERFKLVRSASEIWSHTVNTGLRALIGSWNTMAMRRPRSARISASLLSKMLLPSNSTRPRGISPGGSGIRRMIALAVTDLPEPDSPTRPKVWPRSIEKDTPSTAVRSPRRRRKRTVRSSSASTVSAISALRQAGIEDVAQAVAEQVEGQHRVADGEAREGRDQRRGFHVVAGGGEVGAPVGRRRRRSQPQERQCRHDQDDVTQPHRGIDDQRRDDVGQDLAQRDGKAALADGARGLDIF